MFAYDTNLDQIAYMSCSNMATTNDTSAFFTFRAGAYRNAGIMLSEAYFSNNPIGLRPLDEQADIFNESPANTNTQLQLALRYRQNYQTVITSTGTPVLGQDYAQLYDTLGTNDMTEYLLSLPPSTRSRRVSNGSAQGLHMEGDLNFSSSVGLLDSVRGDLMNNSYTLALTYAQTPGAGVQARSVLDAFPNSGENANVNVYGKGYQLVFTQPYASQMSPEFPAVVLSAVTEAPLDPNPSPTPIPATPIPSPNWVCPSNLQFRIVRSIDINADAANCVMAPDPETPSAELTLVRQSLRVEDWYVDMQDQCIIAKAPGPDCYGTPGSPPTVDYNLTDSCSGTMSDTTVTNPNRICTAYASICYRTN
jgi:hypothetical protein